MTSTFVGVQNLRGWTEPPQTKGSAAILRDKFPDLFDTTLVYNQVVKLALDMAGLEGMNAQVGDQ